MINLTALLVHARQRLALCVWAVVVTLTLSQSTSGADLFADNCLGIDGAFSTIQGAVKAAKHGDIIWVSGYFHEEVTLFDAAARDGKDQLELRRNGASPAVLDGDGVLSTGLHLKHSEGIRVWGITIQRFRDTGLHIEGDVQGCLFSNCQFVDTTGAGIRASNGRIGSGVYVSGRKTDNLRFLSCVASGNALDGLQFNSEHGQLPTDTLTNITVQDCRCDHNDRQGLRTQNCDGIAIVGGHFDFNGATGIQIEQNSHKVAIDGVTANDNGRRHPGEKGIWIDEATDVTVRNCETKRNPFGIGISQSERVTIEFCTISQAREHLPSTGVSQHHGGISVGTGAHHYRPGSKAYPRQPLGGVRNLTIDTCTFRENGTKDGQRKHGDIWYGDTRTAGGYSTAHRNMEFRWNKVVCSGTPTVDYAPLIPEDTRHQALGGDLGN